MKFSNTSARFLIGFITVFVLAGCASKPERKVNMPSWVDIYDRYDEDGNENEKETDTNDKEEDHSPESAADATNRLKTETPKAEEKEPPVAKAEPEEKTSSLFDFFWGKKEPTEPTLEQTPPAEGSTDEQATTLTEKPEVEPIEIEKKTPELVSEGDSIDQDITPAVEPPKPIIPSPRALTAKNEQHALEAKQASGEYQRALKAMKTGNPDDALLLFQELNGRYPTLSGPIVNQAIILRTQGKLEQAKALLQSAILNKTQNPYLMNELGLVNRALGKFEAAKQSYLSSIRLEPNYDKAHYNLGVLADLYLHDPALAFTEFEAYQALQETPNKKVAGWLKEIKRRIK